MKVATIVGARPQFVKTAVVSRTLRASKDVDEVLIHTGQHYDHNMSDVFFAEMRIPHPNYSLGIGSGTHGVQTGRMLEAVEQVLLRERPDWVLVYGDTNSTLAGALAAVKLHLRLAHVEAGVRGFDRSMPEEVNRVLTDHVSDLLFAPTVSAVANLHREGIGSERVRLVGDVMYDSVIYYSGIAQQSSRILTTLQLTPGEYVLATVHRAENTDNTATLRIILSALRHMARDRRVVLPLHPRTRRKLESDGVLSRWTRGIDVTEPVGYLDMLMLERNALLVVSDSGGVPKEAFFQEVPSVILSKEAIWGELVDLGWSEAVDPSSEQAIVDAASTVLSRILTRDANPFGDGTAAMQIAQTLLGSIR